MALEAGHTIGPYEVSAKIGEGGMGEVYQARDTKLDRNVALKVLPEAFTSDPDRLARFEREAKVLASLNHTNIGHIYGLEEQDDTRALVLELVDGPTLADRIAQGPIAVDDALPIARQIADALEAAHEQGVIHRDLKPANIKVRPDGTVKVLDFGLAKAFQPEAADPNMSLSPTISLSAAATQMGMVIGTAAYMAPEQAKGLAVDKRADIWAFGAVLFEMFTGKKLFEAGDVSEMLAAVLIKDPDISSIGTHVPDHVRSVIRRCLVKDPKERLRDIGDVRLAMTGAFETTSRASSMPDETLTRPAWQRAAVLAATVLVAFGVGGAAVWMASRPAPPRVARFQIPLTADQDFRFEDRRLVALSPDGSQVVYQANVSLWLRPIDQLQATEIRGTGDRAGRAPFFSPDGQEIGFWVDNELQKVAVNGGTPVTLAAVQGSRRGASWGADGTVLYGQPDGIWQVPGEGGTSELLIPVDDGYRVYGPQMLPGGEWVLFTLAERNQDWDDAEIIAQSVATGERTVLVPGGRAGHYLPTGHLVFLQDNGLFAVAMDASTRQVAGGRIPLVEGVADGESNGGAAQFSVSADGSLVYVPGNERSPDSTLAWITPDGDLDPIQSPPREYGRPRVSPDGTRIAVDIVTRGNQDIWIVNLDAGTESQLTFEEGDDNYVIWSPDSAHVLFTSSREGGGLYRRAADGTGQIERLKDGLARPYAWTPDGRLIFEEAQRIGVLSLDGERTEEWVFDEEFVGGEPALSGSGRWLAYYNELRNGPSAIEVAPFPDVDSGGPWSLPAGLSGGNQPLWSTDGRALFYRNDTDLMVVPVEANPTFSFGVPRTLVSLSGYAVGENADQARLWDVAPDGERVLVLVPTESADDADHLVFVENWIEELKARVPVP